MTAPNRNARWAAVLVDELVEAGLESVCVSPGSRSTPLTVAAYEHDDLGTFSHLDERSGAYFALGRARRTGDPVGLLCTSGTAAANFHPAVIEAHQARVPLVVLTADRPPELVDSGANQTIDQTALYGDAVRWFRQLPEPSPDDRPLRRLRVDAARAVAEARGVPPGPVHVNVPFAKPLEPVDVEGDGPTTSGGRGVSGREGPYVRTYEGVSEPDPDAVAAVADAVAAADRVLFVAGPAAPRSHARSSGAVADAADAAGAPLLADPLSGYRFGEHVAPSTADGTFVCGGYDAYLQTSTASNWPEPDVVVRTGASPTSKALRTHLADTDARQFLVDPAGEWREAEFVASDLVTGGAEETMRTLATALSDRDISPAAPARSDYRERFARAEAAHWRLVDEVGTADDFEGAVVPAVLDGTPDDTTVFASNSTPVRDVDRFAAPDDRSLTVHGNRGASGIDGITSTALGVASASSEPVVAIVGDLAFYHDSNGLLAGERCDVDATIVLVDNGGGGIFHRLPIESFDPPFTEAFKTPHGIDFSGVAETYDLDFRSVDGTNDLREAVRDCAGDGRLDVIEATFDAEGSQRNRERLVEELDAVLE